MGAKLKLNSSNLANKELPIRSKGYDAFVVDGLLDQIIGDYEVVENSVLLSKEEYQKLNDKIAKLEKDLLNATIEIKSEKDKWKYVKEDNNISADNYELLKRIGKLEKYIETKLHLSLEEINSFDPDDC